MLALLVFPAGLAVAQPAPKTPTEAYMGYRAAQLDSMPADQRGMMLEMVKDMSSAITNVKVAGETITGEKAVQSWGNR